MFKAAAHKQGHTVRKCLEQYYTARHKLEEGEAIDVVRGLLKPVAIGPGDVVDTFSFIWRELIHSVFIFFGSQVRVRAPFKKMPRFKDREDMVSAS